MPHQYFLDSPSVLPKQGCGSRGTHPRISPGKTDRIFNSCSIACCFPDRHFLKNSTLEGLCPFLNLFNIETSRLQPHNSVVGKCMSSRIISFVRISSVTSPKCSKMISAFKTTLSWLSTRDSMNLNIIHLILRLVFHVSFFSNGKWVSCIYNYMIHDIITLYPKDNIEIQKI